jgi:cell division septation protein DedD
MTDEDDDSRLGAYAPPADEYDTFDARDEDSRRGPLLLGAAVVVAVLFFAVVISAYNQGIRHRDEAPRILADSEPYRERPADPGGEATPDTQFDVYDRISGEDGEADDVSLRPAPEEPLEDGRPALRVETVNADGSAGDTPPEQSIPDVTPRAAPPRPQRQPDPEPAAADPIARQVAAAEPEPAPVTLPVPETGGDWVVQIASFRSEADAEAAWLAFLARFEDISSGLAPDVLRVDITDRGTYHRLRIAAFSTRDAAVTFCTTLQGRGQDCLVARR